MSYLFAVKNICSALGNRIETSLDQLIVKTTTGFNSRFGGSPSVIVAAPGRVNLIGEHIDYNDGFVLPLAIERHVVIAATIRASQTAPVVRVHSLSLGETETIRLDEPITPGRPGWIRYIEGVIAGFIELGESIPAFDAVIGSSIPLGAGLSSSAALEVAMATLLERVTGRGIEPSEKALLCQRAEHRFAGVPCGIMDQFASVFGRPGELMLIDCLSQQLQAVPFDSSDVSVLITNSHVQHELSGGQYAIRRSECDAALKKLGKTTWRDVTLENVNHTRVLLTDIEFRRARHVVSETIRTIEAAEACRNGDWIEVGKLMDASHDSLRDDYNVSCYELDVLVEIVRAMGRQRGVFGSRMTGGGFGGCNVSLVSNEQLESVIKSVTNEYRSATGIEPHCFASLPARGAQVIQG